MSIKKIEAKKSAKKSYSYKAYETDQKKALKVAQKHGTTLSTLVSDFVTNISKNKF